MPGTCEPWAKTASAKPSRPFARTLYYSDALEELLTMARVVQELVVETGGSTLKTRFHHSKPCGVNTATHW